MPSCAPVLLHLRLGLIALGLALGGAGCGAPASRGDASAVTLAPDESASGQAHNLPGPHPRDASAAAETDPAFINQIAPDAVAVPEPDADPSTTSVPDAGDPGIAVPDAGAPADDASAVTPSGPGACPDLFRQDEVTVYDIEIAAADWDAIYAEFKTRSVEETGGDEPRTQYPITLRFAGATTAAMLRLKGQSSWRLAALMDTPGKMQFVISFNEVDPKGRFFGARKIELDMPRSDRSFLNQRLALAFMRDLGVPAQCANSARVIVNGKYYGLFTAIERPDKEFLQRVFDHADAEGDLWEAGINLDTNETTSDGVRNRALWAANDIPSMLPLIDLDQAITEWAGEAVLPNGDGYWGGNHNFYLYDHPRRGFLWIPHDMDAVFNWLQRADMDLVYWWLVRPSARPAGQHYRAVINDPVWLNRYVDAVERAVNVYDGPALQRRIDAWAAQIRTAAVEDPHKIFTPAEHITAVAKLRDFVVARADFVRGWVACARSGGPDADGDGVAWCRDCDDRDPAVRPGTAELCGNDRDDDCDGVKDNACQ